MKTLTALLLAATCAVVVGCATSQAKRDGRDEQRRDFVARKAMEINQECIRAGYAFGTLQHRDCVTPRAVQLMDTFYPRPGETDSQKMLRLADLLDSMPPETDSQKITRVIVEACQRSFEPGSVEAFDCVAKRLKQVFPHPRERRSATCTPAYGGSVTCTED